MPDEAFLLGMPGSLRDWGDDGEGRDRLRVPRAPPSHLATIGLYDPRTGACRAFIDGTYITAIRTSAAAAVADRPARARGRPHAGDRRRRRAGRAPPPRLPAGPRLRRDPRDLALPAPTPSAIAALHPRALVVEDAEAAVPGADVVALATHAAQPVIEPDWIAPGTHVSSVGYRPPDGELPPALSRRPAVRRDPRGVRAHPGRLRRARRPDPDARPSSARCCSAARPAAPTRRDHRLQGDGPRRRGHRGRRDRLCEGDPQTLRARSSRCSVGSCAGPSSRGCRSPPVPRLRGWAVAAAHDSLAPAGASHNWLPAEEWVGRHWIPFDEQALKAALGLRRRDLHAYLYNDHRVLADPRTRARPEPRALADRLVAPWQGISDEHRAMLRERTLRILTQGHLAQHMFFHVFHGAGAAPVSMELLGMYVGVLSTFARTELSYLEIASRGGVAPSRSPPACRAVRPRSPRGHRPPRGMARGVRPHPVAPRRLAACWLAAAAAATTRRIRTARTASCTAPHRRGLARDSCGTGTRTTRASSGSGAPCPILLVDPTEVVMVRSLTLSCPDRHRDRDRRCRRTARTGAGAGRSGPRASIYPDLDAAPPQDVADARRLWQRSKRIAKRLFPTVAATRARGYKGHVKHVHRPKPFFFHLRNTSCTRTAANSTRAAPRPSSTGTTRRGRCCSSPSCTASTRVTSPPTRAQSCRGTHTATAGRS